MRDTSMRCKPTHPSPSAHQFRLPFNWLDPSELRRIFCSNEGAYVTHKGLRGETSIAELYRKEGIAQSMYYGWSKEFLEAGKRRARRRHGP